MNKEKAEVLNSFFASCFNKSHPPVNSMNYALPCIQVTFQTNCCVTKMKLLIFSFHLLPSQMAQIISRQECSSTRTAFSIIPSVTMPFNLSLKLGRVYRVFGRALTSFPFLKFQKPSLPTCSYRPISLLIILNKTLERRIFSLLTTVLDVTCPLVNTQRGFTAGRFTISALLSTTTHWFELLDAGRTICAVFFDYHKPLILYRIDLFLRS